MTFRIGPVTRFQTTYRAVTEFVIFSTAPPLGLLFGTDLECEATSSGLDWGGSDDGPEGDGEDRGSTTGIDRTLDVALPLPGDSANTGLLSGIARLPEAGAKRPTCPLLCSVLGNARYMPVAWELIAAGFAGVGRVTEMSGILIADDISLVQCQQEKCTKY